MDNIEILDCGCGYKLIRVGWIIHFWLLNETHFVWLEVLTMLFNNPIIIF